ncbi:hypothetical protein [Bdellovibrio bacteriovorus]|uniref:Protochlamydia outer membrane protein domain-containing protein n=1 Tax=Bdellovibrio bacteriovorus TaxID=959 RepID=A0A1Z3N761_BDEBC|nr:hypothetical protein [Bdellovibrio bacteriovorus]ASD63286.1 hypothetical protein B9G79_06735 [Bdellovibrio bacteriovorus]
MVAYYLPSMHSSNPADQELATPTEPQNSDNSTLSDPSSDTSLPVTDSPVNNEVNSVKDVKLPKAVDSLFPVQIRKPHTPVMTERNATISNAPDTTQTSSNEPNHPPQVRKLTLSAGIGSNYLKFDQTNSNAQESGQFSAVTSPTFMAEARLQWNDNWIYSFSYNQMPGKIQTPTSVTIDKDDYTWSYFGAEAMRKITEGPAGTQFYLLGGLQRHQMPFLVGGSATDVALIQNQIVTASLGVRMEWQLQNKWFVESFLHYQTPLSATSSSGNFQIASATSFDGLVGLSRPLSDQWRFGVYWFGQSHSFSYDYSSADHSTERQGTQKLFNSDLQLRLSYQWDLSRP